jgi:predicted transposase YbfD/YdcC
VKKDSFAGRLESSKTKLPKKESAMDYTTDVAELSDMDDDGVKSLFEALSQVPDYRHKRGRRYEAAIVLTLLILGKLAGERTVSGIAHWARLRQAWLTEVLGLTQVPCANTYHYVCEHLDVVELNAVVQQWFAAHRAGEMSDGLKHWALDGKMLRGSHRRTPTPVAGQEVLNVYDVDTGCLQHCAMIESKGYEAAAAQDYIGQTDCAGVVVTADALHTRPRFARRIRRQHGHYVLLVKGNRAQLEAEIRQLFALPPDPSAPVQTHTTVDIGHGRQTTRTVSTSTELNLALNDEWRDVAQVFLIERYGTRQGKSVYESVCGVTSLTPKLASPAQLLAWVRAHWHIENRCHWRRDVTLGEDACIVRHPRVATVLAVLNSLILALFDLHNVANARVAIRTFAAFPEQALALLTQPL